MGENGNAPVGYAEALEVWTGERGRLEALRVGDLAEAEVPCYLYGGQFEAYWNGG